MHQTVYGRRPDMIRTRHMADDSRVGNRHFRTHTVAVGKPTR